MSEVKAVGDKFVQMNTVTEHGEVVNTYEVPVGTVYKKKVDEPKFIKMYIEDIAKVINVDGGDIKVFLALMKYMQYDNTIDIPVRVRESVAKELGYKNHVSVSNAISRLKKSTLLIPLSRGSYKVNPEFVTKQNWQKTKEVITHIRYTKEGDKIINVEYVEDILANELEPNEEF